MKCIQGKKDDWQRQGKELDLRLHVFQVTLVSVWSLPCSLLYLCRGKSKWPLLSPCQTSLSVDALTNVGCREGLSFQRRSKSNLLTSYVLKSTWLHEDWMETIESATWTWLVLKSVVHWSNWRFVTCERFLFYRILSDSLNINKRNWWGECILHLVILHNFTVRLCTASSNTDHAVLPTDWLLLPWRGPLWASL